MKLPKYLGGVACHKTGEYRPPRAGEFYVTGALPTILQAAKDLQDPFHIVEANHARTACQPAGVAGNRPG